MRVPFPLSLRIGTDIIATSRILSPLEPDIPRTLRLTRRFLVNQEIDDLNRRFPDWSATHIQDQLRTKQVAAWLAGRWAAKEAAKKAWDASLLSFRDLRVETQAGGAVQIVCDSRQTRPDKSQLQPERVAEQVASLSISHDGDYTIATVLATPLHADILSELKWRKSRAEERFNPTAA